METFKSLFSIRRGTALLASFWLVLPLVMAGDPGSASGLAESERLRRHAAVEEAQELLRMGDLAYEAGRYADALEAYAGTLELIPDAPASGELRAGAAQRYAQAAVAHARELSRQGDIAGAKAVVDRALMPGVAPGDAGALAMRGELDDPIRTNPALTAAHTKDIDQVRRLLYTAEGAYGLGKFVEASQKYEEVLRIDPHNSAARRGMEQVAAAKGEYGRAAYDQTRAAMLNEVDAAWEMSLVAPELGVGPEDPGATPYEAAAAKVSAKLERIMIPKIALDQASLDETLDLLRVRAMENDTLETDPARKGVNFTVNLGAPDSAVAQRVNAQRFDLRLSQVPLLQVLKYVTDLTQTSFTTDDYSVIITARGSSSDELLSRSYRVPPDFITSLNSGVDAADANADPFATDSPKEGLLTKRLSAQEALTEQGIAFPQGASAVYSPATNTLTVVNTATNQDMISQMVATMSQTEPVTVVVRVTMIRTERSHLEELGFDWLISPFAANGSGSVFAGGGTAGNGAARTSDDFISPVDGTALPGVPATPDSQVSSGLITGGLRSGDFAIRSDSLSNFVNNPYRSTQVNAVAPGVLAVTGLFSDGEAQMVMRGLEQKRNVDIMAQPSIITRSGQASKIEIIRELIYPTEYEPPEVPNSVGSAQSSPATPSTPTAFEKKDVGISLEVLPVADANRRFVDITLNPSFSDFDGFVNYGTPINTTITSLLGTQVVEVTPNTILMPVFSIHRAATQLTVADGATIVLGGLLQERVQDVADQVPVLGSIPVVGRFFQSTARQPVSTAIIFMVHVELLDPTGRPYRDR